MASTSSSSDKDSTDTLKDFLKKVLKNHGHPEEEVAEIILNKPKELAGEHFATEAYYANIRFKDTKEKPWNLFVKKYSSNPYQSESARKFRFMEKESAFFIKLLPKLKIFCQKYKEQNFLSMFPKCLHGDVEMIVFEYVVFEHGYEMLDKEKFQDYDAAKIVVKNLAQFHAVTYAFIQNIGREEFLKKFAVNILECFEFCRNLLEPMFNNGVEASIKILEEFPTRGSREAVQKLQKYRGKALNKIHDVLKINYGNPLLVLNHGDPWNNNMLFIRDPSTCLVKEQVFVDLQITRFGSPCLDLGYYIFTSYKMKLLPARIYDILKQYYCDFTIALEKFGMESPINFTEFFQDFIKYAEHGFIVSLHMKSTFRALKGSNVTEMNLNGDEMIQEYNSRIEQWVKVNPEKANKVSRNITESVLEFHKLDEYLDKYLK